MIRSSARYLDGFSQFLASADERRQFRYTQRSGGFQPPEAQAIGGWKPPLRFARLSS
jgi:hypothetical protein